MASPPFGKIKIGAATLKGNAELHNAIEQGLNALVSDGSYTKIVDQWGQGDLSIQN
jgi:polar amino acid transport system substrate-binding protein